MATRKTEKAAEQMRISQIGDFKSRMGGVMELPSGLVVKTRNPGGLRAFMASGTIPNNLMAIIQKGLDGGKETDLAKEMMPNGKVDTKMMSDMNELIDNIALRCIVEPHIWPRLTIEDIKKHNAEHPEDVLSIDELEELRDDNKLYIDEIPDDDKQFLFQWVSGGTKDLERFRAGQASSLGTVLAVQESAIGTVIGDGPDAGEL